jgi:catechol 2,3-dioxygenase
MNGCGRFVSTRMTLPASTTLGAVELTVSNLDRSLAFYTERLGLDVHRREGGRAALGGEGGESFLRLVESRGARPAPRSTGLYHFAILVPSRAALAASLARLAATRTPLQGASDHGVSEALYLADPDENGIEIYRDRPTQEWPRQGGRLHMRTDPLDVDDLLGELPGATVDAPMAAGTRLGHVHLHVADLGAALAFYCDVLGFELQQLYGAQAAFVSAGGYHHHVGLNTWRGVGAPPPPPDSIGLREFEVRLPDRAALEELGARLAASGTPVVSRRDEIRAADPSGNGVALRPA